MGDGKSVLSPEPSPIPVTPSGEDNGGGVAIVTVAAAAATSRAPRWWHASHPCEAMACPPAAASERSSRESGRTPSASPSSLLLPCRLLEPARVKDRAPLSSENATVALAPLGRRTRAQRIGELRDSAEPATSSSEALPLPPPPLLPLLLLLLPVLLKLLFRRIALDAEKMSFSIEVYSNCEAPRSGPPPHKQVPIDSS